MSDLDQAEAALCDEAVQFAAGDILDAAAKERLLRAADTYARARWASRTGSGGTKQSTGRGARSGVKVPFGKSAGVPIEEAETKDLRWLEGVLTENVDDPKRVRFRAQNVANLDAIRRELASR